MEMMESHQLKKDSSRYSDSHQEYLPVKHSQRNTSRSSVTIPPFASLITNSLSDEALPISSETGLSFASGIAGTGLSSLFEPFNRSISNRFPQDGLLRVHSIVHPIADDIFFSGMGRSPKSPIDMSKQWTPMILALERLQQALHSIPTTEKLDYLAALQVAPDLILKESDPTRFLRCTNFDAVAAARKLVFYWKSRRSIFGDRAYRPMTMTGDGALSAEDIAHLKSGYIAYAPKDQEGCTVAVYDGSRRTSDLAQVRKRGIFYHGQHFSENPMSHTSGFVILCIVNAPKYDSLTAEGIYMLTSIFPLKLKAWHILDCMSDQNPQLAKFAEGYLLGFMESFLHRFNKSSIYFHSPASSRDTLWELVTEHGVSLNAIPDFLGGTWTYERFDEWWIERLAVEKGLFFFHLTGEPMAYESRRTDSSPRSHKRSKRSSDEEESPSDEDSKHHASYSSNNERTSMEYLLEQFQQLVFSGSGASTGTGKPHDDDEMRNWNSEGPSHRQDSAMFQLEALYKALDAISVLEKVDFLTAWHVVPHLVLQESDPARFLAFHEFDPDKAAQGMIDYWKQRQHLFGDRAFLPMTMTGDGALSGDDIAFYKCGGLVITGKDRDGNLVLIFDADRRTTEDSGLRMRTAFYTWQILFANHTSEFVVIQIISGPDHDKAVTAAIQMALRVFPVKAKALHTFDMKYSIDLFRRGFVQALIGVAFNLYSTAKTFFHSPERNNLQNDHGLSKEVLPCNIGGTWSYERFDEWQLERIDLERKMHFTAPNDSRELERPSLESQQIPRTNAATHSSDAMLCEQNLTPLKNAVQFTSPHCTSSRVQTSENSTIRDNKYLLMLDTEIRRFPLDVAAAYMEAIKKAPREIWDSECSPESFLRVEDFDARKAAERLVRYWQLRSQIYGPRRHDRLTQTGDGVLGRQDYPVLNTGFLTLLPMDSEGRSVLCINPDRLVSAMCKDARDRCIFYMMSLVTENEKSQTDGVVLIHKVSRPHFSFVNAPLFEKLVMALPIRLNAIHLICYDDVPLDAVKSLEPLNAEVHVHTSNSRDALLSALESFGMTKPNLPKFVNGDWGYETFVQWQEYRTRMEWRVPFGLSERKFGNKANFPGIKFDTQLEADVAERKRRINVINFRRKQNRDRVAIAILKENSADLQDEQNKLRQENQQLEAKHAAVSSIVLRLPRD